MKDGAQEVLDEYRCAPGELEYECLAVVAINIADYRRDKREREVMRAIDVFHDLQRFYRYYSYNISLRPKSNPSAT